MVNGAQSRVSVANTRRCCVLCIVKTTRVIVAVVDGEWNKVQIKKNEENYTISDCRIAPPILHTGKQRTTVDKIADGLFAGRTNTADDDVFIYEKYWDNTTAERFPYT